MKSHAELFETMGKMLTGVRDGTVSIEQAKAGAQVGHVMVELLKVEASIVSSSDGMIRPQLIDVAGERIEATSERGKRLEQLRRA